jgi:hypothetical protein
LNAAVDLRDYFAAHASENDIYKHRGAYLDTKGGRFAETLYTYTREQGRYRYADAMLAARGAQPAGSSDVGEGA